jgi:N-acetylglutamate synthase-like GNAT family acetyltransferase
MSVDCASKVKASVPPIFTVEPVEETSFHPIGTKIRDWAQVARKKMNQMYRTRPTIECIDSSEYKVFESSARILSFIANSLEDFPLGKNFDTVYACQDASHELRGIMLTKKKILYTRRGEALGNYLMVVYLATHPHNIRASVNKGEYQVTGCGTALISHIARECLKQKLSGIYLEPTQSAERFYEKLGFERLNTSEIAPEDSSTTPMRMTAQAIRKLIIHFP